MNTPTAFTSRTVERLVRGRPTSDGAGVRLTRVVDRPLQQRLDPFLMLDAFGSESASDYLAGFPEHPHRGFETVTIMKAGRMQHRDSVGNVGLLEPGSVQWMTAGRGIVHSEMPQQHEGRMAGFQLWVNLAAADKMQPPAYRDVPPAGVPQVVQADGARVRVIAGAFAGTAGAVQRPVTEPRVLDITLPPGAAVEVPLPAGHNAFAYVYTERAAGAAPGAGADPAAAHAEVGGRAVPLDTLAILGNEPGATGVRLAAAAGAAGPVEVLLVAGAPLREPIAQHGPFVMNSVDELHQAVEDFQRGVLAA